MIAANISAEQFIGMSGSGFNLGLAIASYEWMAALTLLIVGKYFLPIFIEKGLYTIPEFVEKRYSTQLKTILAVFWIALYVFVNLASVLYLGSLALETIMGIPMIYGVLGLALFAVAYSLYGGLSAVSWTDVIQVVFLILGGMVTTYLALDTVSGGQGMWAGFQTIYEAAPDKFAMILDKSHPEYNNLPGIGVLVGGMWVANVYYWGFNQYIIQRTLAAKSLNEAQNGILFAAGLKLILPPHRGHPRHRGLCHDRGPGHHGQLGGGGPIEHAVHCPSRQGVPVVAAIFAHRAEGPRVCCAGCRHCFVVGVHAGIRRPRFSPWTFTSNTSTPKRATERRCAPAELRRLWPWRLHA